MPSPSSLSRRRLLALGLGSAAGLLAACATAGAPSAAPAPTRAPATSTSPSGKKFAPTVRLGFQPPYIGVFAMQNQKLLEAAFGDAGPAVEYRRLLSLNPIVEALSGGAIDLGMGGTPLAGVAADQPIRILALVERSPKTHAILLKPDSPIKSIADLRGKKLGTPSGKAYVFPLRVLERAGIKASEVDWITLENNEGRSALLTGAIDAWVTWDPFFASAQAANEAVPLVDGDSYQTNYVTLFGRTDYVEQYPDTVRQFIKAYQGALGWVQANHAEAVRIFAAENKTTPEVTELTLGRRNYLLAAPDTDDYLADVTDQGKLFAQLGVTQKEPDWKSVIAPGPARAVLGS